MIADNYMIWSSIQWFYSRFIALSKSSDTESDNREETCIQFNLKFAISREYVKNYISPDIIDNVRLIQLHKIRIAYDLN